MYRTGLAQWRRLSVLHYGMSKSPTNARKSNFVLVGFCHVGCQEVTRCYNRGIHHSQKYTSEEIYSCFELHGRYQQKSKTRVSGVWQKELVDSEILKKKRKRKQKFHDCFSLTTNEYNYLPARLVRSVSNTDVNTCNYSVLFYFYGLHISHHKCSLCFLYWSINCFPQSFRVQCRHELLFFLTCEQSGSWDFISFLVNK